MRGCNRLCTNLWCAIQQSSDGNRKFGQYQALILLNKHEANQVVYHDIGLSKQRLQDRCLSKLTL